MSPFIKAAISTLDPLEQKVLNYRYGIGGTEPMTYISLSNKLGIPLNEVKRIRNDAMEKLSENISPALIPLDLIKLYAGEDVPAEHLLKTDIPLSQINEILLDAERDYLWI